MRAALFSLLLGTFILCSCTEPTSNYELVWSDEFDQDGQPDPTKWAYQTGNGCPELCGWGNKELQSYTDSPRNARVEDGKLIIEVHREEMPDSMSYSSARLVTLGKASWEYGKVEFNAKIPEDIGTWSALWMLGERLESIGWPDCGEIDVMEHVGKDPGRVHFTLHSPSSYGVSENSGNTSVSNIDTEFHTYAVEWTPDSIAFSCDNQPVYTYAPEEKNAETWPFTGPFYLLMNIAMGGNWGSEISLETNGLKNGIDSTLQSTRMEVDFVRVYQKNWAD